MIDQRAVDAFEAIIAVALNTCIDEDGMVDLTRAANMAAVDLTRVALLKPEAADLSLARLRASLDVADPYKIITPEERSLHDLNDEMIAQNVALLKAMLDSLVSEQMRKPVGKRTRTDRSDGRYWRSNGRLQAQPAQ